MKKNESKSLAITTVIGFLIIFLLVSLGLKYYDPPIEYGMEVSFGNVDRGGKSPPQKIPLTKPVIPKPKNASPKPIKQVKVKSEKIVTEEKSDVAIPQKKEEKEVLKNVEKEPAKEKPKEVVSEATKKTLSNFLQNRKSQNNNTNDSDHNSFGNDNDNLQNGMKGNPYSSSYYGGMGRGGQKEKYGLKGRIFKTGGKVVQECNEQGLVVVRIVVNTKGEVVEAYPGVKGSTNVHPCLLKPAKETAFLHKWAPDPKAPSKQIGFVVIDFKIKE